MLTDQADPGTCGGYPGVRPGSWPGHRGLRYDDVGHVDGCQRLADEVAEWDLARLVR
jgi:hypothetical protein